MNYDGILTRKEIIQREVEILNKDILEFSFLKRLRIEKKYPNLKKENYLKFVEKIENAINNKFGKKRENLIKKIIENNF